MTAPTAPPTFEELGGIKCNTHLWLWVPTEEDRELGGGAYGHVQRHPNGNWTVSFHATGRHPTCWWEAPLTFEAGETEARRYVADLHQLGDRG